GYVLLQGHLDGWFEAAADNGGGAAAVLAAAERLAGDSGRGLLVALYDAEEWGLRGSKVLAEDLASPTGLGAGPCGRTVRLDDIVAVVNLDAPSAPASDVLGGVPPPLDELANLVSYRVLVFSEEPTVTALLTTTSFANGVLGLPIPVAVADPLNGGVSRTDVRWFHEAGIPAAWPVVGYPEYHTTADTLEVVDPADLERVTAGAVDLVRALSTASIGRLPGSTLAAPGASAPPPCPTPVGTAPLEDAAAELPATGSDDRAQLATATVLAAVLAALAFSRRRGAGRAR
ncbi:MAG: M28 family peptidase, partial [Actinomycetota bacterium]|nr:M28 family peptidase [Actinomycetota bacterium]